MKKSFFKFLMLAVVAVAMGTFVACKDTSDDMFIDLENKIKSLELKMVGDNATLKEALQTQISNLETQLGVMQAQLDAIKSCDCDQDLMRQTIKDLTDRIAALESGKADAADLAAYKQLLDNLTASYEAYKTVVASTYATKESLTNAVADLEAKIGAIKECDCNEAAIWAKLNDLELDMVKAQTDIDEAKSKAESAKNAAEAAANAANAAKAAAETASNTATSALEQAKILAETCKLLAEQTASIFKTDSILAKTETIINIKEQLSTMQSTLGTTQADAAEALERAKNDSILIDRMQKDNSAMSTTLDSLKTVVSDNMADLTSDVNALEDRVKALETKTDSLASVTTIVRDSLFVLNEKINTLVNEKIKMMSDSIAANAKNIGEYKLASEKADSLLQEQVDSLAGEMTALKARVKKNEEDIAKLLGDVAALKEAIARQITGIEIQKVTNPWFGSFSTPFDVSSNVLIAFYGNAANNVYFPASGEGAYAQTNGHIELTPEDMKMIAMCNPELSADKPYIMSGRPLFNRVDNRADGGEVYVTINPNGLDCSGIQLELVNTIHETAGFNLTPLASSNDILDFGWTRAGGLYKTVAYVDAASLNKVDKIDIDGDAAKDALKTLKDIVKESLDNNTVNASKTDLLRLAGDMKDVVESARLHKSLLRAPWTDVNNNQNYTSSRADIAATAVTPLSFETFKDLNVTTLPGFNRANVLLDRVSSSLKNKVNGVFNKVDDLGVVEAIRNLKITKIEIADLTEDQLALFRVEVDTTFVIDGLSYYLDLKETVDVPVKFTQKVNVPIEINKDIEVDMSNLKLDVPTFVLTPGENGDAEGNLVVPIKDEQGNATGQYATINLSTILVKTEDDGKITINGNPVAKLEYKNDIPVEIKVDTTMKTTINIKKDILIGDYKLNSEGKPYYVGPGQGDCKTFHLYYTVDLTDAAEELWGTVQGSLGDVNKMLAQVDEVLDEVNKMLDEINDYNTSINNSIDHYIDKIKDYLQNANDKLAGLINSANSRLQPVLLASDSKGIKDLSQTKAYPTIFTAGNLTLTPTTWTMELVAPACRKHVAVTNVFKGSASAQAGDAGCLAALKAVNGAGNNVNKRLDGQTHTVNMQGLKAGYVYEVAYSALDYHGKIATRKYYLTIQ